MLLALNECKLSKHELVGDGHELDNTTSAEDRWDDNARKGILTYQASALLYLDYSDIFRPVSFVV